MAALLGFIPIPESGATMAKATIVHHLDLAALEFKAFAEIIDLGSPTQRIDGSPRLLVYLLLPHLIAMFHQTRRKAHVQCIAIHFEYRVIRKPLFIR